MDKEKRKIFSMIEIWIKRKMEKFEQLLKEITTYLE